MMQNSSPGCSPASGAKAMRGAGVDAVLGAGAGPDAGGLLWAITNVKLSLALVHCWPPFTLMYTPTTPGSRTAGAVQANTATCGQEGAYW